MRGTRRQGNGLGDVWRRGAGDFLARGVEEIKRTRAEVCGGVVEVRLTRAGLERRRLIMVRVRMTFGRERYWGFFKRGGKKVKNPGQRLESGKILLNG